MRYFIALAQERNFTRASQRLCIAQPPLTRQIKAIEAELGTELFVRTSKGVNLTDAGRVLLVDAPKVLALSEQAVERAKRAGHGFTGRLDVGVFGSGMLSIIPSVLGDFHEALSDVAVHLHAMTKIEQLAALRDGRISVGFNRIFPAEPDIGVEIVSSERLVAAVCADQKICVKRRVSLLDLDD